MCQNKSGCTQPENLKGKPEECSAEQIAICHPGEKHSCENEESEKR
jgi:quercetin dioxygenase-like cupin family protein